MNSKKIKSKDLTALGSRLRQERLGHSLTQSQCADVCKVSTQTQGFYESGERAPNAEYFFLLREQGIDANFVLFGDNRGNTPIMKFNTKVLTEILEEIESFSNQRKKPLSMEVKAELIGLFHSQFSNMGKIDREMIQGYLKLVK